MQSTTRFYNKNLLGIKGLRLVPVLSISNSPSQSVTESHKDQCSVLCYSRLLCSLYTESSLLLFSFSYVRPGYPWSFWALSPPRHPGCCAGSMFPSRFPSSGSLKCCCCCVFQEKPVETVPCESPQPSCLPDSAAVYFTGAAQI